MGVCSNWATACQACKDAGLVQPPTAPPPPQCTHVWMPRGSCLYCGATRPKRLLTNTRGR